MGESTYAFDSEETIYSNSKDIIINIEKKPLTYMDRLVFDGQKITAYPIRDIDPESYIISHELAHVVSFLESGVLKEASVEDENKFWSHRKSDWENFLATEGLKPIKEALSDKGLSEDDIKNAFITLFETTEEARNLLGFRTTLDHVVGEFCFFHNENKFLLPIYRKPMLHGESRELNDNEKLVLKTIANEFGIRFQGANEDERMMCHLL